MPPVKGIPLLNRHTGVVSRVHPNDVRGAIETGDWIQETPEQQFLRKYQEENAGSAIEYGKTLGESYLGEASLGAYDAVTSGLDEDYRKLRQARAETFGSAKVIGQVGAYATPFLGEVKALGAVGKVAKAIGTPLGKTAQVATAAGKAAERAVAGAGAGTARRTLAKGVGGAVSGATEGAIISAGQAVSDAAISDKELTSELLVDHVKHGAAFGGTFGGALGVAVPMLSAAAKGGSKAAKQLPAVSEMLGGKGGATGLRKTKALTAFGALGSDIKKIIKDGGPDAPARIGQRIFDEAGFGGKGAIGRALKHDIEGAAEFAANQAEHYGERVAAVYKGLDDEGKFASVSTIVGDLKKDVLAPLRASNFKQDHRIADQIENNFESLFRKEELASETLVTSKIRDELRTSLGDLYTLVQRGSPKSEQLFAKLEGELLAANTQFRKHGNLKISKDLESVHRNMRDAVRKVVSGGAPGERQAARLSRAADAFARASGRIDDLAVEQGAPKIAFSDLWKLQRRVDKTISSFQPTKDVRMSSYHDARNILKRRTEEQIAGTDRAKEFAEANAGYGDWVQVKKIAESRMGSLAGNRTIGLTDSNIGIGAANAGAVVGTMVGGPLVGAVAGAVTGGAAVLANKVIRSASGDRLMAVAANSVAEYRALARASGKSADRISRKAEASVKPLPKRAATIGLATRLHSQFEANREALLTNQDELQQSLTVASHQLGALGEIDPKLTMSVVSNATRGNQYLLDNLPKTPGYIDAKTLADLDGVGMSDEEKFAFDQKFDVVERPSSVIDDVRSGKITPTKVNALKATSPRIHRMVSNQVLEKVSREAERGMVPSFDDRINLGILTGYPIDASARPNVIRAYQRSYSRQPNQGKASQSPVLRSPSSRSAQFAGRRLSPGSRTLDRT
jgi:hypothetical protein